jgi:hypothetical protein
VLRAPHPARARGSVRILGPCGERRIPVPFPPPVDLQECSPRDTGAWHDVKGGTSIGYVFAAMLIVCAIVRGRTPSGDSRKSAKSWRCSPDCVGELGKDLPEIPGKRGILHRGAKSLAGRVNFAGGGSNIGSSGTQEARRSRTAAGLPAPRVGASWKPLGSLKTRTKVPRSKLPI